MRHGIIGLTLVITFQFILLFKITPIGNFYFPFIWFGFIFVMDEIVFQLKKSSLIYNHFKKFILMLILSAILQKFGPYYFTRSIQKNNYAINKVIAIANHCTA